MSRFTGVAPRKIMEGNLYFAFSFIIFLCSSAYAVDNLKINVDQDSGTFQISLSNQVWFNSGGVFARSNGAWHSTETVSGNGKLKLTGKSTATGKLDWGPMNIYFFNYMSDDKFAFTTYIVVFEEVPAVIFGQQWDSGGTDSSTGNNNDTISMWPTFKIEDLEGVDRGYMSWAGSQISNIPLGKFDSSLKEIHSRMDGGLPVAIFDSKMENTVVISPQNTFMSSHQQIFTPSGSSTPIFSTGILGSVNTVPKGYSMETLLVAGNNVTGTMEQWGRLLRLRYKKHDHYRLNDYSINYLGYYTDNGACYYYATDKFANYEEALIAVKKEADAEGIPYRYVQLDSWWYYKGMHNGVKNWTAMPSIFPRGIEYVANVTGWPIVAHNRYFSPNTDYASQNGGQYKFIIDTDKVALPDDPKFWTDLLSDARDHWNLYTYEQDWLSTAFSELTELQSELGLGERWLSDMAYAAKDLGLTIQYCMTYPRHALQSVTLPAVTQVRASADYGPGDSDWMIFDSSVLHHAIGLAPYKDTFHTETTEEGCKFTKPEPAPALMTYVSVLSGGPVGPSDTVNGVNKALIMATCAQDGLLLKPSRPALSLDSTFVQRAFGKGGPNGVVSAAYTEISDMTWYYILGADINTDYSMPLTDLPPSHSLKPKTAFPQSIAVQYSISGNVSKVVTIDGKTDPSMVMLSLSKCGTADFQYWLIAPVLPKVQMALLGDLSKVVSVSEQRVVTVIEFGGTYVVKLRGAPGEMVTMTAMDYSTEKTATFSATIGQDGVGAIAIASS